MLGVGLGQETGCWVLGSAGRLGVGCWGGPSTPLSGEENRSVVVSVNVNLSLVCREERQMSLSGGKGTDSPVRLYNSVSLSVEAGS